MNERDLRKLSRVELLEMLLDLSKENDSLTAEMEKLRREQADRKIALQEAGSIAEAAVALSKVFQAAQEAADLYLDNIRDLDPEAAEEVETYQTKAQRMLEETEHRCQQMVADTQAKCDAMLADTQREVDKRWQRVLEQIDALHLSPEDLEQVLRGEETEGEESRG